MKKIKALLEDIAWSIEHAEIDEDAKSTIAIIIACLAIGMSIATLIK